MFFPRSTYRQYYFFVNLQVAIDRALMGIVASTPEVRQGGDYPHPFPIELDIKPFPWPKSCFDLAVGIGFWNFILLITIAF